MGKQPVNLKKPDWKDMNDGRWFLSMYSNQSDEVEKRHTGHSISEEVNINNEYKYNIRPYSMLKEYFEKKFLFILCILLNQIGTMLMINHYLLKI